MLGPTNPSSLSSSSSSSAGGASLFSAALFYKDITAFNFNQTQLIDAYPDTTNSSSGILLDSSTCLNPYAAPSLETGTGRLNADGVLIPVSMYDAENLTFTIYYAFEVFS